MKFLRILSRYIVGIVFIFSSFVKGLDPMGTMFKIEDYFIAYGTEWAMPFALFLTVVLCTAEFVVGILLVLNVRIRIVSWLLLIMMLGFTAMTFYDALYEPVPDCGCFGDAIIMTNWQTFYKNVVLMVFTLIILFTGRLAKPAWSNKTQNIIALTVILLFAGFTVYSYNRLPIIDFRDWKVGRDMAPDHAGEPITYLIYQKTGSDEQQEFLSSELPWQDSVWMSEWEFVDIRIDDSHVLKSHELQIIDAGGDDVTDVFLENPGWQFLLTAFDLEKANKKCMGKINDLYDQLDENGYDFIMITAGLEDEIETFRREYDARYEIFNADDIVLKTMVRSNPGLILLKDGVVIDKWHYHNFPDYDYLIKHVLK